MYPIVALGIDADLGVAAEPHLRRQVALLELPGIARLQPQVAHLLLPAVDKGLVKDAELVADPIADRRDLQAGQGIEVTGGQTTETAIAQARFLLVLDDPAPDPGRFPEPPAETSPLTRD